MVKESNRGKALKITLTECYFRALWQRCELLKDFTYILIADCNKKFFKLIYILYHILKVLRNPIRGKP